MTKYICNVCRPPCTVEINIRGIVANPNMWDLTYCQNTGENEADFEEVITIE